MKRIFLVLMILSGMYASAQVPSNYLNIRSRYNLIAVKADSTLHIPKGTTPSLFTGGSTQSGAVFYKTSDSTVYVYTGTQWISVKGTGSSADSTIFATLYRLDTAKANIRTSLNQKIDSLRRTGVNVQALKNGSWITQYTDSVGSGGGGSQDLQDVTDLGDSTTQRLVTNDSLKAQDAFIHGSVFVGDTLYARGDSLIAFGTSITGGSGVSGLQRFSRLIADRYGMIEANYGGGGNPIDALYGALYKIPTKTSNRGAIMLEYNMNDASTNDTATWKSKMITIIDTALARGWTSNKIIVVGGPFSQESARPYLSLYVRAARTVSELKNTKFIDAYSFMQSRGGTDLTYDSVHPSILGHIVIFEAAKTAFLEFKKIGLVDVSGSIYGRKAVFAGVPPTTSTYPYNSTFISSGKSSFQNRIYVGTDTTGYGNSALINVSASSGQTGLSVKDNGSSAYSHIQGGEIQIINSSGNLTKYGHSSIVVGNGSMNITGSAGRKLLYINVYGGVVVNEDGNTDDFRIEGDNQTHLFYTNGTNDRIGFRTASPDSNFTFNGSARFASTVRLSGLPTGKQAYQIYSDANGTLYRGDSTVGGVGGGGTTYKIGTYNSQTPNDNGASIVGDSIYMQPFSAENPGLVPPGGSNITFLRGDGTWQTVSGSASPAGNYGNVQLNRNGALATPGSDSLDYESATGLSVKGDVSSTGQVKVKTSTSASTPSIAMSSNTNTGLEFFGTTDGICATINGERQIMFGTNELRTDREVVVGWNNTVNGPYGAGRNVGLTWASDKTVKVVDGSTNLGNIYTGGVQTNYSAKTTTYTIAATDYTVTGDATSGAFTITLPTAASVAGKIYVIKKTDSSGNAVTVGTTSSQTIDGSTTYSLASQYKYVTVQSNGSNWFVISNN